MRITFVLFVLGMCLGIIGTFEFIMLSKTFDAPPSLMGMCRMLGVVGEIPMWWWAIDLMDHRFIGIRGTQAMSLPRRVANANVFLSMRSAT